MQWYRLWTMCGRKDSGVESNLKLKVAEGVSADYTDFCVCLKGMLRCILNCFLTIGDTGMPLCYVLLSWGYLFWQQNPEIFSCTVKGINCSTEICANIPMLSVAALGLFVSPLRVPLFVLTCYLIHHEMGRFFVCDSYLWPLILIYFSF